MFKMKANPIVAEGVKIDGKQFRYEPIQAAHRGYAMQEVRVWFGDVLIGSVSTGTNYAITDDLVLCEGKLAPEHGMSVWYLRYAKANGTVRQRCEELAQFAVTYRLTEPPAPIEEEPILELDGRF